MYKLPQRDGASGAQDLRDVRLAHKIINMMFKTLNMLGYGKTLGRGLGRELAQLRKINVMSDWRQTTNEAMDGRRHGQGALGRYG